MPPLTFWEAGGPRLVGAALSRRPQGAERGRLFYVSSFFVLIHCMMITATASANASIGSRNHCFCVARALTVCSRSKPRAHGPGLLATAPRCAPAPRRAHREAHPQDLAR